MRACLCDCLSSGCGEHLIRTMLARECSAAVQSEDAHQALLEAMQNKFISESPTRTLSAAPLQTCVWKRVSVKEHQCARGELSLQTDVA